VDTVAGDAVGVEAAMAEMVKMAAVMVTLVAMVETHSHLPWNSIVSLPCLPPHPACHPSRETPHQETYTGFCSFSMSVCVTETDVLRLGVGAMLGRT
jgi:hypothetical protein